MLRFFPAKKTTPQTINIDVQTLKPTGFPHNHILISYLYEYDYFVNLHSKF